MWEYGSMGVWVWDRPIRTPTQPYTHTPTPLRKCAVGEDRKMSGHSKWHNIRLKKGKVDAERGKTFTKLAREIIVAARAGGGNPDGNLRLRLAVQKARD